MTQFPPRLPQQPIFYPVANAEYARQIARDWNTPDEKSGFCGFVTVFSVDTSYLSQFDPHRVGSSTHVEYWIPAGEMGSFNRALEGQIGVDAGFFGSSFRGHVPLRGPLQGQDAVSQFGALARERDRSTLQALCEDPENRKAIFMNLLFWEGHDFFNLGMGLERRAVLARELREAWRSSSPDIPLPPAKLVS